MLEVWLAAAGSAIAGAAKGYAASFNAKKPRQLFVITTILAAVGLNEADRFRHRRKETRAHIPGASGAHLMDDTIIESSPTYLVDNFPLFAGIFATSYTLVGGAACLFRSQSFRKRVVALTVKSSGIGKVG